MLTARGVVNGSHTAFVMEFGHVGRLGTSMSGQGVSFAASLAPGGGAM
jgi:hypothetical protein